MDQDALHHEAVEIARRILSSDRNERYELGVPEPGDNSRVFEDLVELTTHLLQEEEGKRTRQVAA